MKHIITAAMCAAALLAATADEVKLATRDWVTNYVASTTSEAVRNAKTTVTQGVVTVEATVGTNRYVVSAELFTEAALKVVDTTMLARAQGITNGMYFVWNGGGDSPAYVNPPRSVDVTLTNMVYAGVSSVETNGFLHFEGFFDAKYLYIPRSYAFAATNRTEVAE